MRDITVEITDLSLISQVDSLGLHNLDLESVDRCFLRISNCRFGTPLGLIYFAEQLRCLKMRFPDVEFRLLSKDTEFRGYADHIGFFDYINFRRGSKLGAALGGKRYVPIQKISLVELRREASGNALGPIISQRARIAASMLSQSSRGAVFDLFEYTLREIMRNSAEHSRGTYLTILGQYWPRQGEAQLAIADNGVGVAENLYESDVIDCRTNLQALKFSLLPGISGVSLRERIRQDDHWGNSGFGLYLTSRICSENGSFTIISGGDAVRLAYGKLSEKPWQYRGTLVSMEFRVKRATNMIARLKQLTEEGGAEARKMLADYPVSPSKASTMLASHFEKY